MSYKVFSNLDLTGNQLLNFSIQTLAAAPGSPVLGQEYFDTVLGYTRVWSGSAWQQASSFNDIALLDAFNQFTNKMQITAPTSGSIALTVVGASGQSVDLIRVKDSIGGTLASIQSDGTVTGANMNCSAGTVTAVTGNFSGTITGATYVGVTTTMISDFNSAVQTILATGVAAKASAKYATTGALAANTYANGTAGVGATLTGNSNGALASQDGQSIAFNDIILVKDEATASKKGLYVVSQVGDGSHPYILTRHTSMDQSAEFNGALVAVETGTTNLGSLWLCTTNNPTVGTTGIAFTEVNKATDLQAGFGIGISGNTVSVVISGLGQIIYGDGANGAMLNGNTTTTKKFLTQTGDGLISAAPGWNVLVAGDLPSGTATSFLGTITGDGATTSFNIDHSLNESYPAITIRDSTGNEVLVDNQATTANRVVVTFAVAPANAVVFKVKVVK